MTGTIKSYPNNFLRSYTWIRKFRSYVIYFKQRSKTVGYTATTFKYVQGGPDREAQEVV